jgi:transposase
MAFAQVTYRQSLRDIETCLRAMQSKLYHCGIRGNVSRTTLAKANENRDWRIYADFAQVLIRKARTLYANEDFGIQLNREVYALDSTTIDLCLSLFPWAKFRKRKAAVKIHTLMDLKGSIPTFIRITDGKVHDVNILDHLVLEPGAIYVMDRGYLDFARLFTFTQNLSTFITRAKSNFDYHRLYYRKVNKTTGLRCDQTIMLNGFYVSQDYPAVLRRIGYFDIETNKKFIFLTNNFTLAALTIAQLYKCRWRIEIFFKWLKQYLRIKTFFGTSANAVKTQIWIAISVYVLVAIVKKELKIELSLGEILQILSIVLFEKVSITQVLTKNLLQNEKFQFHNQLLLFNL